jgi:hypothetical protein
MRLGLSKMRKTKGEGGGEDKEEVDERWMG